MTFAILPTENLPPLMVYFASCESPSSIASGGERELFLCLSFEGRADGSDRNAAASLSCTCIVGQETLLRWIYSTSCTCLRERERFSPAAEERGRTREAEGGAWTLTPPQQAERESRQGR